MSDVDSVRALFTRQRSLLLVLAIFTVIALFGGTARKGGAGELQLIFPTRRTLERLAQHASFDEIVADALSHPIEPISPWVDEVDGERFITIPQDIGFPVTRERLEGLWRG